MRVMRILLSTVLATLLGALGGAALFGVPTYFSKECGFLGCDRGWALYFAIWGAIFGVVPGACVGLIVARFNLDAMMGTITGGGIGVVFVIVMFALGAGGAGNTSLVGVVCILIFAISGLTVALINRAAAQQIVGREPR
jgi:hypothetical protein